MQDVREYDSKGGPGMGMIEIPEQTMLPFPEDDTYMPEGEAVSEDIRDAVLGDLMEEDRQIAVAMGYKARPLPGVAFYYLRDDKNRPHVTVCVIPAGRGRFVRGIAICSPRDQFSKKIGRAIAFGRAQKTVHETRSWSKKPPDTSMGADPVLRREAVATWRFVTADESVWFASKRQWIHTSHLTRHERRILGMGD
jgi:hypothetical protein